MRTPAYFRWSREPESTSFFSHLTTFFTLFTYTTSHVLKASSSSSRFFFFKSEKREVNVELLRGRRFRQLWRQIQIIVENIYIFFLLTTFKKPNACFAINIFTFAASCRTPFIWRPRSVRRNDQMCSCSAGTKTRRIERIGRLYLKVLAESFQSPLRADRKALRWKTDCLRSKNRRKDAEWEKEKETTSTRGQYGHRHLKTNLALERITLFLTS